MADKHVKKEEAMLSYGVHWLYGLVVINTEGRIIECVQIEESRKSSVDKVEK